MVFEIFELKPVSYRTKEIFFYQSSVHTYVSAIPYKPFSYPRTRYLEKSPHTGCELFNSGETSITTSDILTQDKLSDLQRVGYPRNRVET